MRTIAKLAAFVAAGVFVALSPGQSAKAGSHTWEVWEVFSNADGTVQFVEIKETHGGTAETGLGGHTMISHPSGNTKSMHNVTGNTAFTYYLLGTTAFAALPGAPTPDEIIPANFIRLSTDTSMEYSFTNTATWTLGAIPTNGTSSLSRLVSNGPLVSGTNSPTNYAGVAGQIDASGGGASLPGVPDGVTGTPLKANKLASDGSSISVSWDAALCSDSNQHQILYGQRSGFPAIAGGAYTLAGGVCSIGTASPYTWNATPSAGDGSGLIWYLVVTRDAAGAEGPWGDYNATTERNGTTSSGVCSTTSKSLSATCGH
jgi:hypothetical protein